jgi:hypothetical protein
MKKLLAVALFAPAVASAGFMTGNDLLSRMNGDNISQIQAIGYVQGVYDAYSNFVFCPPNGVSAGQVNDMIKNYITNTPATRNKSADILIGAALKGVWPCEDKGKRL